MRVLSAAALAVAVAACSHKPKAPPPAPIPVLPPLVALEAVGVEGLGFKGADLAFRARVENPNPAPLSAVRVEYALDLEGRRAAQGVLPTAVAVPAAGAEGPGTGAVELPVQLRWAAVPGVAQVLAKDQEAEYALAGAVVFHTPAGDVRVPMSARGRMIVPRTPRFRVERVVLRSASPREIALELKLDVENPNAFEMPPGRVGCGLHLSGKEVVRADLVFAEPIAGGATASAVAPVKVSVLKAGKAAARLLIPFTSLDAELKGEAVFGGVPVPLDLPTSIRPGQ
ncbi:MAG TPA: LEA type 2 family protein [Anaeromyxobacter sp.]|nr:LEA type 2 family protein [Anaeromyxobacter sp.]